MTPEENLRAELARIRVSQSVLCRIIGVINQFGNNVINDRYPISRSMARKLAELTCTLMTAGCATHSQTGLLTRASNPLRNDPFAYTHL
jgi:hypothetical protein